VLAHRGASLVAPENTLAAFRHAVELGADAIETDVRATRDGVPVLIHDPDVERTTDGAGAVAELSLVELQRLDAGARFRARGTAAAPDGSACRVPTLAEALAALPGVRFNLELKCDGPGDLVAAVLDTVVRAGRAGTVLLTAEDDARMGRLRRSAAGVAFGASRGEVEGWVRAAAGGGPTPVGPMALQVPVEHAGAALVTPELLALARARGVAVHVWTVNEPSEMRRLVNLGVDGIVTDDPSALLGVLGRRRGRTRGRPRTI